MQGSKLINITDKCVYKHVSLEKQCPTILVLIISTVIVLMFTLNTKILENYDTLVHW